MRSEVRLTGRKRDRGTRRPTADPKNCMKTTGRMKSRVMAEPLGGPLCTHFACITPLSRPQLLSPAAASYGQPLPVCSQSRPNGWHSRRSDAAAQGFMTHTRTETTYEVRRSAVKQRGFAIERGASQDAQSRIAQTPSTGSQQEQHMWCQWPQPLPAPRAGTPTSCLC